VVAEAAQLVPDELGGQLARLRAAISVVLRRRARTAPVPWRTPDAQVSWFVGPAGSGKTTTVAKVAAFVAFQERERVAVLTLDTGRPGTTARLRALAAAMDVPFEAVDGPLALRERVAALRDRADRVLVDTPPPGPTASIETVAALVAAAPGRTYLCLPADGATRALLAAVARWRAVGVDAVVATRVDEAVGLGAVFAAHCALERPLALLCTGPGVPDDVEAVGPEALCRRVLTTATAPPPRVTRPDEGPGACPEGTGHAESLATATEGGRGSGNGRTRQVA
jgi:flagellar biosynthesis GTPase FlhF